MQGRERMGKVKSGVAELALAPAVVVPLLCRVVGPQVTDVSGNKASR